MAKVSLESNVKEETASSEPFTSMFVPSGVCKPKAVFPAEISTPNANLVFVASWAGVVTILGVKTKTATSLPFNAMVASGAISVSELPSLSTTVSIESK